jgi:hypothetical protein
VSYSFKPLAHWELEAAGYHARLAFDPARDLFERLVAEVRQSRLALTAADLAIEGLKDPRDANGVSLFGCSEVDARVRAYESARGRP